MSFNYTNGSLTGVPGYASSITYHPNGMVHKVAHGNGTVDTIAQDPWRMRRPYNISVSGPVGNPSLGVHKYDGSGNLVSKSLDGLFLYDKVGRLEYFEAGSGGDQTYTFDAFGNMTQLVEHRPSGTEVRNFPVSTATNRLTNAVYDDAGNMTSTSGQTYEYDGFNMLRHRNFPEHSYLYTADDERLLKYTFSGTPGGNFTEEWIWTIRDLDGKVLTKYDWNGGNGNVWEWKQDTIYRDGLMLAKETDLPGPQGEQHFHLDHLGTPRLTTQSDGSIYAANHYFGFGDALNETSDPERQKFTGHERDKNGGATHAKLDYMHARYYSPYMARFMSVDPRVRRRPSRDPQNWNRFVYSRNSPVRKVDRDGRQEEEATSSSETSRAVQGAAAYSGAAAAQDGAVRERYAQRAASLGPTDGEARSRAKMAARAQSSPAGAALSEVMRPARNESSRTGGTANRTNPRVNAAATAGKAVGRASVAASFAISVVNVANAPEGERAEAATVEGTAMTGALAFGAAGAKGGAAGGAAVGPAGAAVGAFVGGLLGGILGAFLGEEAGENINEMMPASDEPVVR